MSLFSIFASVMTLAAVFSYLNYRYIHLPTTIGVMVVSLGASLIALLLSSFGFSILAERAATLLQSINFSEALLQGMLSLLLFAGALHINIDELSEHKWIVGLLATVGVLISTLLIGTATFYLLKLLGIEMSFLYCLLFGSLISPTDPIAVLSILKTAGAPKSLEMQIAGESLFNDGVGVVVFLVLAKVAVAGEAVHVGHAIELFAVEALGGAVFGFAAGYLAFLMLKRVDNYQVEILITLALVMGRVRARWKPAPFRTDRGRDCGLADRQRWADRLR